MGKKRTSKDRLYLTATEYQQSDRGYKSSHHITTTTTTTQAIPYNQCGLSHKLLDIQHCVTTPDGYYTFDLINIIPYIKLHNKHPIFNTPLHINDLIKLHWTTNTYNQLCDPITMKPYTECSYIVAIRTTGNVYTYDTINTMCIRLNEWNDLVNGTKFTRDDIITLQNPNDTIDHNKRFKHNGISSTDNNKLLKPSTTTEAPTSVPPTKLHSIYSNNLAAASLTSTAAPIETNNTGTELTVKQLHSLQYRYLSNKYKSKPYKSYITLHTTSGTLNIQIHCDLVPSIAHNFVQHCKLHTYNNTKLGRIQSNYLVQCGQSMTGNDSTAFNYIVDKQYHRLLSHNKRGIIAMSGSAVKQQFYITFNECTQLDQQYCIIGEVVGNMSTLNTIESQSVDGDCIPYNDILITSTTIYSNPFDEPYEITDPITGNTITYNQSEKNNSSNGRNQKQGVESAKPSVYTYDTW